MSISGPRRTSARNLLHHRTKTAVLGTVLASTALVGCSINLAALPAAALGALIPFNACDDALDYLQSHAATRVGPYGLDQAGGVIMYADGMERAPAMPGADQPVAAPVPGSTGHSGTTNQEIGVDEADVVKTDGEYLYTASGSKLVITDVRDGAPKVVAELDIATPESGGADGPAGDMITYQPWQLLLDGDTVLVVMTQPHYWAMDLRVPAPGWGGGGGWSQSVLVAVDVSDPTAPRETSRLTIDGDYLSARMIDGTARVVIKSMPMLPFESPYSDQPDADWSALEKAATERNREIVGKSTIDQWLPSYTLDVGDQETTGQLVACEDVSHPKDFSGFTTVSVLTIPLVAADLDPPLTASVLGDGEIVYASTDRLYVVTNRWEEAAPLSTAPGVGMIAPVQSTATTTGIHAFDITGDGVATHVASGEVSGRVIGQYAMSEQDGVLRVATTDGDMWGSGPASESKITTLAERDGDLVELGSIGGLGEGEQIYAVRYVGDTAYVVTFRQTDPLYVLDLSDPSHPSEIGKLKITGYSSYLFPFGVDRLIGVGQEATESGGTIGLQVSLFDTSDPALPVKLDGKVLRNTWSDAEWDPHAFLSWEPTGQVMVPVTGESKSGLLVLTATDDGLVQDGLVQPISDEVDGAMAPTRTVIVDDRLYTVWWGGIQGNDLATLAPLGWAGFTA
jgi:uncharacterized secreted protein with C-terminal beta-propeller domain